jgi:MoaA/NifB/PqqE/SkfB family radical SAM enzyme
MTLDKAKTICKTLRSFYGNTAVDIQGGEPTIYEDILALCAYCRDIGLHPTLITNALALARPGQIQKYQQAGVRDFLVSVHGIGEVHDEVVGRSGAYERIEEALGYMIEADMPFRFNCTMSKPVVPQLPEVARKAIETGAPAVNFIAFNPFGDQEIGRRTAENTPRYSDLRGPLTEAIDLLEEAGVECNVRYLPLCIAEPRHRKNFYNYQQLPYDLHEWDFQSWLWTMMQPQMMRGGDTLPPFYMGHNGRRYYKTDPGQLRAYCESKPIKRRLHFLRHNIRAKLDEWRRGKETLYREEAKARASIDCKYRQHEACRRCPAQAICDGFHGDYADLFGTSEATPLPDIGPTENPKLFISEQEKIVEEEDKPWAL